MPSVTRRCQCVSLHTYPAVVTAGAWDLVLHICACGREHLREDLLAGRCTTPSTPAARKTSRKPSRAKDRRGPKSRRKRKPRRSS